MKILHTSDWHLGHRLHDQSQLAEQTLFLEWLETQFIENDFDILLIAGDIFDTGAPSAQSLRLYYDFLVSLTKTNCKHIVIAGGNHDSAGTLNAPKELLSALSIKVIGKATEQIADEVFKLSVNEEEVIIAAIPYLRDQDIRRAVAGESFDQITDRYKQALVNHYQEAADYCDTIKTNNTPVIAMGHLFAVGGTISDSEQNIYVGSLGHIGGKDFPETFDFIALGHLHRPQIVGGLNHIRYSGSPNILSFSEVGYDKRVIVLTTNQNKISNIEEIEIPQFRVVKSIKGKLLDTINSLSKVQSNGYGLTPWVEVVIDNQTNVNIGATEINQAAEGLDLEVLKITLKNKRNTEGIEKLIENTKNLKELSPIEVFEKKCTEQEFDLNENKAVFDAFSEALQIAQNN